MAEKAAKIKQVDVPDPGKLSEHGASIDVAVPDDFEIADPWAPTVEHADGAGHPGSEPGKPPPPGY